LSDPGPEDSCALRVSEIHSALKNAGSRALCARWALAWWIGCAPLRRPIPRRSSGCRFCRSRDKFSINVATLPPDDAKVSPRLRLPAVEDQLELRAIRTSVSYLPRSRASSLAMSQTRNQALCEEMWDKSKCRAEADADPSPKNTVIRSRQALVNVSTDGDRSPDYVKLQNVLLSLSQNSKELIGRIAGISSSLTGLTLS